MILYFKYDNFSTTWCMTRLPWLPIIYVRAHYIIQLEIHKSTSYFFGYIHVHVFKYNMTLYKVMETSAKI